MIPGLRISGLQISGLQAVVFDWAGTMIDFGSRAPVVALCNLFAAQGVPLEEREARGDMGVAKRDHIAAILRQPRVHAAWTAEHGAAPDDAAVDLLFGAITPLMREAANSCAVLIPGAAEVVAQLRAAGVRIGSCTGYTREMMADILPAAAAQGYAPDVVVCAGETAAGRPSPLMLWKNLVELGAWPATACVKVDDAAVGIAEGRGAGVWTIGVAASGNSVGLSAEALAGLPEAERTALIAAAHAELSAAGAHLVIDTVADLPGALAKLKFG
ncbi:MAG: phosphonoacetaldehyde hydrolase [Novosphingobium sp.]